MWTRGVFWMGLVALAVVGPAHAYVIDDLIIESWAGWGDHEAVMVLDFWPGDGQDNSFAFGYRFDALSITGLDLLDELDSADNGLSVAESGGLVTDFWYDDGDLVHHVAASWPDSWWSYWLSDDFGETWESSMVGAADRVLYDGDADGWLAKPGDDFTTAPVTPVIPEPETWLVTWVGGLAVIRRWRCRRGRPARPAPTRSRRPTARIQLAICMTLVVVAGTVYAADPWADEIVAASPELDGSGIYNDPQSMLGHPATTYWDPTTFAQFRVSLVAPPIHLDGPDGDKLITSVPAGQFVVVRFDEPVEDHPRNPFGIDLLVFGNSFFQGSDAFGDWVEPDTDMSTFYIDDGGVTTEPVLIGVSATGIGTPVTDPDEWYVYEGGPYGDSLMPTNAYQWDADSNGWGEPLDFTTPVDPSLTPADFAGRSAAEGIELYEYSGGGTGIDLTGSGFDAIQFVYLSSRYPADTGEVDALSDVFPWLGDADRDGDVDLRDFARFQACHTGADGGPRDRACFFADFDGDRVVDDADYAAFGSFLDGPAAGGEGGAL